MKRPAIILTITLFTITLYGQSIMELSLKDVSSDQTIKMSSFANTDALVVIFTSTKCPYVKYYDDRINSLVSRYSSRGVSVVLANANSTESESAMKKHAELFKTPYLSDNNRSLANLLKAKKSPEAFVVHDGVVVYSGAIDDNPQVANQVKNTYLTDAIDGFLKDQSMSESQRPFGCMIK